MKKAPPDVLVSKLKLCQTLLDCCNSNQKQSYTKRRLFEVQLNSIVRNTLVNKLWSHFQDNPDTQDSRLYLPFLESIEFLNESCSKVEKLLYDPKYEQLRKEFFMSLKTQILYERPHYLNTYLTATYSRGFETFLTIRRGKNEVSSIDVDMEDVPPDEDCLYCGISIEGCNCESTYEKFCMMNNFLRTHEIIDSLVGDIVLNVSRKFIEKKVSAKCRSDYSCSYLNDLSLWLNEVVKVWIVSVYKPPEGSKEISIMEQKLEQFLSDAYAEIRVSHLFDIVIEYPASEAAIQDLKMCLEQSTSSEFRLDLIESVKQSFIDELLHPGIKTRDILTAYISAIKALRALDPTGLILQLVTEPVRRYLKSREDTVRCIVTALTDEDHNSELNREMIRSSSQTNENGVDDVKNGAIEVHLPSEGEKCTVINFEKWKPDPIKLTSMDDVMKSSRFSDIVSILVNIYETKDLFVEEYQKLLSQRLLNKYNDCNLDTELRNLELLTIRFSDCELHRCEVMLKDVQTSKRINKRILSGDISRQRLLGFNKLDALIVSSPFWPDKFSPMATVSDEPPELEFPPEIESALATYTRAFEAIQASRTLHWRHHLGFVDIDVTVGGRTQNFVVSPLHLAILYLFKQHKTLRLSELMHKTSIPAATLRSRIALWQRNGLIRDLGEDKYELIESD